jgi:vancomycin resistance protein YoaR
MRKLKIFVLLIAFPLFTGEAIYDVIDFRTIPKELNLIFPDKTLTINFEAQPELLTSKVLHFIKINKQKIYLDFAGKLPKNLALINLESEYETVISEIKLQQFFKEASITRELIKEPVEINLDKDKNIIFTGKPHDGYEIEFNKLVKLINKAIKEKHKNIRVPAQKVFSTVIVHPELSKQGIHEILAVGESNFSGSSRARRQNIKAGAARFNGIIIGKNRQFSFNEILESVNEENGFVKELVIKGNKTEKELGGGVCQVSTTAFRAAFTGGLPIKSRRAHSYAVPYYKPFGLDAAIYLGALDFRFINDTPGNILIQTFIENDNLFFVFYGTKDQRRVSFEGPFISEYKKAPKMKVYETEDLPQGEMKTISVAHAGFTSEWIRRVDYDKYNKIKDHFVSTYRPWPAKVLKGIGKVQ